jgi:hypothetical protein
MQQIPDIQHVFDGLELSDFNHGAIILLTICVLVAITYVVFRLRAEEARRLQRERRSALETLERLRRG